MSFQHKRYNSRRSFLLLHTLPCLKFITVSSFFLILFDCGARTSPLTPLKIQLVAFGAFSHDPPDPRRKRFRAKRNFGVVFRRVFTNYWGAKKFENNFFGALTTRRPCRGPLQLQNRA
jgi:hypothetical protein